MTTIDNAAAPGVGDVGELYGLLARRLEKIVRLDVGAPDALVEDACQVAWMRLLHHRHRVHRETVLGWLARTAVHEAFKLWRRESRERSLDAEAEDLGLEALRTPVELVEQRERLSELHRLPERQQRAVWLNAFGFSYAEIARHEGDTSRTVERQLLRARQSISATREPPPRLPDD